MNYGKKKKSNHVLRKLEKHQQGHTLDPHIKDQFGSDGLLACISSRPAQCGRADGYILEGKNWSSIQGISRERREGCQCCCLSSLLVNSFGLF